MSALPNEKDLSPALAMADLISGCVVTQAIYVAAKLKIADALAAGPLTSEEIATRVGAAPKSVQRLLRTLTGYSAFTENENGQFALTPFGDTLRADSPDSMRNFAILMGHPQSWLDWPYLFSSVCTGQPSRPHNEKGGYDFLTANPEYAIMAGQGMACISNQETGPVLTACDFSRFTTIVDVGGGRGGLLAGILRQASNARGILFDEPFAVAGASASLEAAGVSDRYTVETGSFFEKMPAGADAYVLKHILHDFTESGALKILENVRNAIAPGGTMLVIEYALPGNNGRHLGNIIDLWLLLLLGSQERTVPEYSELFAKAGFKLTTVTPTTGLVSVIEAVAI